MSALRNACSVLRLLRSDLPVLTVSTVASRLALPMSTTSRLLGMMAEEGLLERAPGSRGFAAGPLPIAVAASFRVVSNLIDHMGHAVEELVGAFGHTGYVSLRSGSEVFAVRVLPGSNPLRVIRPVGDRLPAHATATGRTLLARLPAGDVKALYADGLPDALSAAPRDLPALQARLVQLALSGIEEADDEAISGVGSIAAAVVHEATAEAASFCLSFPGADTGQAARDAIRAQVRAIACRLGQRFDDPFWRARA